MLGATQAASALPVDPCSGINANFMMCLTTNNYLMEKCQPLMDKYSECERQEAEKKKKEQQEALKNDSLDIQTNP
jgi:hypothetical protein